MSANPISADLLAMLRCPLSGQTLAVANPAQIACAHERWTAARGQNETLPNGATASMTEDFAEALIRADGTVAYPVRDGIPVLLADEAINL